MPSEISLARRKKTSLCIIIVRLIVGYWLNNAYVLVTLVFDFMSSNQFL